MTVFWLQTERVMRTVQECMSEMASLPAIAEQGAIDGYDKTCHTARASHILVNVRIRKQQLRGLFSFCSYLQIW